MIVVARSSLVRHAVVRYSLVVKLVAFRQFFVDVGKDFLKSVSKTLLSRFAIVIESLQKLCNGQQIVCSILLLLLTLIFLNVFPVCGVFLSVYYINAYVTEYTVACNEWNSVACNTTRRRLFCFLCFN